MAGVEGSREGKKKRGELGREEKGLPHPFPTAFFFLPLPVPIFHLPCRLHTKAFLCIKQVKTKASEQFFKAF